jgi:predicted amidophosphoribosyltransferase
VTGAPPLWGLLTLKRRLRRRRRERGLCPQCGYDLRGSRDSGRCPECGTGFVKQLAGFIRRVLVPRPCRAVSSFPA